MKVEIIKFLHYQLHHTPLLNDPYHNDTENGGKPNITVKIMIKVLFVQCMLNRVDEQAKALINDGM